MILYVRQSAWLGAEPDDKGLASKGAKKSRLAKMRQERGDDDYYPEMPPCESRYLLGYLMFDLGPSFAAGSMGPGQPELELAAWQSNTGIVLSPWESRVLKRLSLEYVTYLHEYAKPDCPPPWQEIEEEDRFALAKRVKSMFRE